MRNLSQIILLLALSVNVLAQSPHGTELTASCDDCHNPKGWKLEWGTYAFNHDTTSFELIGMHEEVDCRSCHPTLIFSQAETECVSCHIDMHNQTVGMDCARCHTPASWLVNDITELHQQSRFPLLGPHNTADCYQCHPSASLLRFEPLGVECYDCHRQDYLTAKDPDHAMSNFSTNCTYCHRIDAFTWSGADFDHAEFPLELGHANVDCIQCHTTGNYTSISSDCFSCHQSDYKSTTDPNHVLAEFSQLCKECHTIDPGWMPARYKEHDPLYFPVYSGKHGGEWASCTECHENPSTYVDFTCISCHEHNQPEMDDEHDEVNGYLYNSMACYECHPTGDAENGFNHSATNFPLTGAHVTTECLECHTEGYSGTTMVCYDCHQQAYNESLDPNHVSANIPTDCETCHTTDPDWTPAIFPIHNEYYELTGAHASIATDCFACHQGTYTNTPNECAGCHQPDFNQTTNPNHIQAGFPNTCAICHSTNPGWTPANFSGHDEIYPLTGAHSTATCFDCHQDNYTNTPNECFGCHQDNYNQTTNPNHNAIGLTNACELCHTTNPGWQPAAFPVHNDYYVLQGAHAAIAGDCFDCHAGNYNTTANTCVGCHLDEYNQTNDPNHQAAQFPTDCEACHSQTAWEPATFEHDAQYFPIYSGKHEGEWNQCSDCHNNPSNYAIFQCLTCHPQGEMDPEHEGISGYQYNSIACLGCHPDGSGSGSFDHNNTNFPLTGAHTTVNCFDCHEGSYINTPNECSGCHLDDFNATTDPNHVSSGFPQECEICHTTNPNWTPASFTGHDDLFPLTGAHTTVTCFDCHEGNYTSTPNECLGCHMDDYNQTSNPNHNSMGLTNDCELCHTPNPNWQPATFPVHNDFYLLQGAHVAIANDCFDCHQGNYNSTPNSCYGCHADDFNATNDPDHQSAQFPTDCELCHTQNGWEPSTFNHDQQYFPIYSGEHEGEWNQCSDCHSNPGNYGIFQCLTCHPQGEMDDEHDEVSGYQYNSIACLNCHPNGNSDKARTIRKR